LYKVNGKVKEHSDLRPTIYTRSIPRSKAHSNFKLAATRTLFTEITSNTSLYSVFPFTFRNHTNLSRAKLGLAELQANWILSPSPVIVEKSPKAIVVRRTVTVLVKKVGEVVILGGGEGESKVMWVKSEKSLRTGGIVEQALTREGVKVVELKRVEGEKMDLE
jgi:hypothetical protein